LVKHRRRRLAEHIVISASIKPPIVEGFDWAIRELKRAVPIWKKEIFEDGEVWVEGEQKIES